MSIHPWTPSKKALEGHIRHYVDFMSFKDAFPHVAKAIVDETGIEPYFIDVYQQGMIIETACYDGRYDADIDEKPWLLIAIGGVPFFRGFSIEPTNDDAHLVSD